MKTLSKGQMICICAVLICTIVLSSLIIVSWQFVWFSQNKDSVPETITPSNAQSDSTKKTVLILATGGTIAGSGEEGKETGYKSGSLTADAIIESVPKIKERANIITEQICNLNSDDMSQKEWLQIAKRINEIDNDPSIDGIVITHGTDTMEETAYFLNLVCKTSKPVILTGSMRPSTAISADGPMNLYEAVLVATNEQSINQPVMVVMDDTILSSRTIQKTSTSSLATMSSGSLGEIGFVRDQEVFLNNEKPSYKYLNSSEFSINNVDSLPRVGIAYFYVDAEPSILKSVISCSDAIVVAGAGAGEFSSSWKEIIENCSKPVVISTRCSTGIIMQDTVFAKNGIATYFLNPQKAAVLLRCALIDKNRNRDDLIRIFSEY